MEQQNAQDMPIEKMLEQARRSGLTYNQAKVYIAKTSGGYGTHVYSDTDVAEVREQNAEAEQNKTN